MKMQLLDTDYVIVEDRPIIRMFGKDEDNKTVCGFVKGYLPYFYVLAKTGKTADLEKFISSKPDVLNQERAMRRHPRGFSKEPVEMLKITLRNPQRVSEIRDSIKAHPLIEEVFEADILFKYRFMADYVVSGMGWIEADTADVNTHTVKTNKTVNITRLKPFESTTNTQTKYLAIDIETLSRSGGLPDPSEDEIIIISTAFYPEDKNRKSLVLTTRGANSDSVIRCLDETEMLEKLRTIIDDYDPDVITGFNINNFDMPFLLKRMEVAKIPRTIGRCNDKPAYTKEIMKNRVRVTVPGRVVADSYQLIKRNFLFKRYGLTDVSRILLRQEKLDVAHSEISKLWNSGDPGKITKLVEYARKDAELALGLIVKKQLLDKYIELSKLSGMLLQDSLDGGEATRVENLLLREFNKKSYVVPCKPDSSEIRKKEKEKEDQGLKGGFVLTPKVGLHADGLVVVLDFRSMYPSIFRSYNICPTTIITGNPEDVDTVKTPAGHTFVSKSVQEGIIPSILGNLLEERSKVKQAMKKETDEEKLRILDAKQLALKLLSNSFYGYTGYTKARLYILDIANAITSCGRHLIQTVNQTVEKQFGYQPIYGDTDSIMIKIPETDLDRGWETGVSIMRRINGELSGAMQMEFEKLFKSFLILTKKRYAAWRFVKENGAWKDKIEMKGIETVRRDWCELVSDTMNRAIDIILKRGDTKEALNYFNGVMKDLAENKIPIEKLVITKSITKSPSSYAGVQPHIELVKKMQKRNSQDAPGVGDRVGYVIIKGNQLLSKRTEDPAYVKENKLEIDPIYYVENQLLPPIERIFIALGFTKSELLGRGRQASLMEMMRAKPAKSNVFDGFICATCGNSYASAPLTGLCQCGGKMQIKTPTGATEKIVVQQGI
ncbi:MAG: ribonuclease H-like domain-containing protein [Candidatus Aenigmarchaeota archaeon]|nr:ribonuclease H-like domain-containing protein [Candidatus Aenigmarchaeota archaeon]